ncbi:MAG: macro domain-containing protein [Nitrospinae bacterium]|nr:macro domain-containing protein [Nitrospinota bacterium]
MQGDITEMATDAIVNPSNTSLVLGAGVSGAIAAKGGDAIQIEMSKIGQCPVGDAVVTGAGNLKARYVIHAVGPRMGEGNEDNKLHMATLASLKRAEELKIQSISFPAISTGVFGFPVDRCAAIMLSTALDHFAREENQSLRRIVFCLFTKGDLDVFINTLKWLKPDM